MCPSAQTVKLQWRQVRLRDWSNGVKMRMLMFSVAEILADMVVSWDEDLLCLHASHPAADVVTNQAEAVAGINRKVAGWFLAGLALLRKS